MRHYFFFAVFLACTIGLSVAQESASPSSDTIDREKLPESYIVQIMVPIGLASRPRHQSFHTQIGRASDLDPLAKTQICAGRYDIRPTSTEAEPGGSKTFA